MKNATLQATKNDKGFIELLIEVDGMTFSVKVNDYNGTQKERARKLTYKVYKSLGGK